MTTQQKQNRKSWRSWPAHRRVGRRCYSFRLEKKSLLWLIFPPWKELRDIEYTYFFLQMVSPARTPQNLSHWKHVMSCRTYSRKLNFFFMGEKKKSLCFLKYSIVMYHGGTKLQYGAILWVTHPIAFSQWLFRSPFSNVLTWNWKNGTIDICCATPEMTLFHIFHVTGVNDVRKRSHFPGWWKVNGVNTQTRRRWAPSTHSVAPFAHQTSPCLRVNGSAFCKYDANVSSLGDDCEVSPAGALSRFLIW